MNDEIREQLSALVDDELSDVERPLLLGRLERDPQLRECLGRYQLISEVMHGSGRPATLGLAARVQQVLQQEPSTVTAAPAAATPAAGLWWKPLAGLAVAASVATVAVLSLSSVRQPAGDTPALATAADSVQRADATVQVASGGEQWKRIEPRIDERLAGYLVNHSEYAASRGVQAVMPYVRIVGYENNR